MKIQICIECIHEDEMRCTNNTMRNKHYDLVTGIPRTISCNKVRYGNINEKVAWYKKLFHSKFNCSQYIARGKII